MKTLALFALLFTISFYASAEDVKLKITYKGDGLEGHKVSVCLGDAVLGTGTTDSGGEVTISVSSLPTKNIDLKGEKTCDGGRKNWSASGYVTLDGSNYAHLKMEDLVAEMVEASGGMMSEGMLVASYGLVCAGASGSNDSASSESEEKSGSDSMSEKEEVSTMSKAEMQAQQKAGLENKIRLLENKISKKQSKIDSGKLTGEKMADGEQSIREWEIEKKITQNRLDRLNLQIEKGFLNKTERKDFKEEEAALKAELKAVKAEGKGKAVVVSEEASAVEEEVVEAKNTALEEGTEDEKLNEAKSKYDVDAEELKTLSINDLRKKKIALKSDVSKLKVRLKTRRNSMTPAEIKEVEEEISLVEKALDVVQFEIDKRQ